MGAPVSNRKIIFLSLACNVIVLVCVLGYIGARLLFGLSALPSGWQPWIMAMIGLVPISCAGIANFLRLRRDGKNCS